ncbi:uncharacterized protein LOC120284115 [Dioscorea cayenensis subsp. rotundata]|uniref:Uncharacterized protein LOC120284115 n=1 Tax=Dioscorea cayennensis subsp. rotundata TaxID=55577 RepID=A0AB40D530_DIOCR|nr:uncharacterized protein LOC120284115 [Dioscorea cayenensis subsp. rotundata]
MNLSYDRLKKVSFPLFSFSGESVPIMGSIQLPITLGEEPRHITRMANFMVIKSVSPAYSAILGRPLLNDMRAVLSSSYLLMKFPTLGVIGQVRGDQKKACSCYVSSIKGKQLLRDETLAILEDSVDKPKAVEKVEPVRLKDHDPDDMPGISLEVIFHHLNVDPKVQYPEWLANVIMVKKSNGKWRVCIDFTNLNKACPKDSYPLPRIDKLVDETLGYELLSFMDAFSGYHQIKMNPSDKEKTGLITEKGTYCYKVMPFGLKNAGATYQRMVNKVFKHLLADTMEAYIDDMIVKSKVGESHTKKLNQVFDVLRKYDMRLNPNKCTFRVQSEKFLSYTITKRGIEANPEEMQAILEMRSPSSMKEVQRLTGRIAALNKFLSKSAERSLPFFKTLRGGKNFEWTSECDKAFEELKEYLKQIPLLTRLEPKEQLFVYLGVSKMALSTVLLRKEEKVDKTVYYVNKVLQGAESRYPFAERVALALVLASRKLRPYFQAHPIVVLIDQPLHQILQRPEYSGRLTKWAIELGEYDICFEPRQAIKGQALADFIVECIGEEELNKVDEHIWKMFVDGASSSSGSRAGVVLISPEGDILDYSLRFAFLSSNNIAEYEALIVGMRLAMQLQVKRLMAHSDSQLVVQQFHGEYEAKEPIIRQYLHKVKTLSQEFEEFQLLQVNRNSNSHADALSKLASSMETKGRIVHLEELQRPSIKEKNIANIKDGNDWRIPFKKFLKDGELPSNTLEAKKLKMRAARFMLINDVLYKKVFAMPLLRCLHKQDAEYALAEVNSRSMKRNQSLGSLLEPDQEFERDFRLQYQRKAKLKESSQASHMKDNSKTLREFEAPSAQGLHSSIAMPPLDSDFLSNCGIRLELGYIHCLKALSKHGINCSKFFFLSIFRQEKQLSGLNYNSRISVDAASGGALMNKMVDDAYNLIEDMALNHYQWTSERNTTPKPAGRHKVETLNLISAKVDALTQKFDKLNANVPSAANITCEICGSTGHLATNCHLIAPPSSKPSMEQMNYLHNFSQRTVNDPFSNTYNPGWQNHPNLSYKSNQPHFEQNLSSNIPRQPPGFQQRISNPQPVQK